SLYCAVNVRRLARSGTSGSGRPVPAPSTRLGSATPVARSNGLTFVVISGIHSIPALGSVIISGRVPHERLPERAGYAVHGRLLLLGDVGPVCATRARAVGSPRVLSSCAELALAS